MNEAERLWNTQVNRARTISDDAWKLEKLLWVKSTLYAADRIEKLERQLDRAKDRIHFYEATMGAISTNAALVPDLRRQLVERRTVTDEMRENAKHYWQTHSLTKMTIDVFIDGMLTAALEGGNE